jgi:hypothetical protein
MLTILAGVATSPAAFALGDALPLPLQHDLARPATPAQIKQLRAELGRHRPQRLRQSAIRVGSEAYFGCNDLWAPASAPECDTSATQLRQSGTDARRMCDGAARFVRRKRDGWARRAVRVGHA